MDKLDPDMSSAQPCDAAFNKSSVEERQGSALASIRNHSVDDADLRACLGEIYKIADEMQVAKPYGDALSRGMSEFVTSSRIDGFNFGCPALRATTAREPAKPRSFHMRTCNDRALATA